MNDQDRTLFVGNLSSDVSEELLYELFLQAGPVENVTIPRRMGKPRAFGFVVFKHLSSIPYAISLLNQVQLYGRALSIKPQGREVMESKDRLGPSEEMNDSLRGFTQGGGRNRRLDSNLRPSRSSKGHLSGNMEMIASLPDTLSSVRSGPPGRCFDQPYSGRGFDKGMPEKRRLDSPSERGGRFERGLQSKNDYDVVGDVWNHGKKHMRKNDDFIRDGSRDYLAPKHRGGGYRYHHTEKSSHRRH